MKLNYEQLLAIIKTKLFSNKTISIKIDREIDDNYINVEILNND